VSEDGFDFHPTKRREPRRFEPPPWERDSFEELAKRRAEDEVEKAQEPQEAPVAERDDELEAALADLAQPDPVEPKAELDERAVGAMLAELKIEETDEVSGVWKISVAVALVCVVIGSVLIVWGMAAIRAGAGETVGVMMTVILLVFGAGFVFGGLYVAARTLRKRGVL